MKLAINFPYPLPVMTVEGKRAGLVIGLKLYLDQSDLSVPIVIQEILVSPDTPSKTFPDDTAPLPDDYRIRVRV